MRRSLPLATVTALVLVTGAAGSATAGPAPDQGWQTRVHDGVRVSVDVQCSAAGTSVVRVHLLDPLSRGAMYTVSVDGGGPHRTAGPSDELLQDDPIYYVLDSGSVATEAGEVAVDLVKGLGTDATKNATLVFDRPAIDCAA